MIFDRHKKTRTQKLCSLLSTHLVKFWYTECNRFVTDSDVNTDNLILIIFMFSNGNKK